MRTHSASASSFLTLFKLSKLSPCPPKPRLGVFVDCALTLLLAVFRKHIDVTHEGYTRCDLITKESGRRDIRKNEEKQLREVR